MIKQKNAQFPLLALATRTKVDFQIETVPADSNRMPFLRSGEFGTSPFFRQLSVKVPLDRASKYALSSGYERASATKNRNSRSPSTVAFINFSGAPAT
jgi:hypothetical protein